MAIGADKKGLVLQVDAAVELAKRNLASLESQVARDSTSMTRSLDRIDKANSKLGGSFAMLKTAAAGAMAALSVGAAINFGRNMLQFADDLATAADQAGVSVERYQTLKEGLRALEVSTQSADRALSVMNATLGELQSGV